MVGENEVIKRLSDFEPQRVVFKGKQVKIDELLDKPLVFRNFAVFDSKFIKGAKYIVVQAELGNEPIVFNSMSKVIMEQLESHKNHLPFVATIKKRGRYYLLA